MWGSGKGVLFNTRKFPQNQQLDIGSKLAIGNLVKTRVLEAPLSAVQTYMGYLWLMLYDRNSRIMLLKIFWMILREHRMRKR